MLEEYLFLIMTCCAFLAGLIYFYFDKSTTKIIFWISFLVSFFSLFLGFAISFGIVGIMRLAPSLFPFYDVEATSDFDQWFPIVIGYITSCFILIRFLLKRKINCNSWVATFFYGLLPISFLPIFVFVISWALYLCIPHS